MTVNGLVENEISEGALYWNRARLLGHNEKEVKIGDDLFTPTYPAPLNSH